MSDIYGRDTSEVEDEMINTLIDMGWSIDPCDVIEENGKTILKTEIRYVMEDE